MAASCPFMMGMFELGDDVPISNGDANASIERGSDSEE